MARKKVEEDIKSFRRFSPPSYRGLVGELRLITIAGSRWSNEVFTALGISPADATPVLTEVLRLAGTALKAKTVLIEPYRSTDWGDEYTARYSRLFRNIPRC